MAEDSKSTIAPGLNGAETAAAVAPRLHRHKVTFDIAPAAIAKIVLTVAAIWLLIKVVPVLILIIFSLMLAATFNPWVRRVEEKLGRSWAIAGVVTMIVLAFLGILAAMIPTLIHEGLVLFQDAPKYAQRIEQMLVRHHIHLHIQQQVQSMVTGSKAIPIPLFGILSDVVKGLTAFITVAILSIYLLIEGPQVNVFLMRLVPHQERAQVRQLGAEITTQVGGYMRGQMITSALAGVFSFLILWVIGVPGAIALGALAAVADVIPLIGLLVAILPAALMALTISTTKAAIVVIAYLIYHQIEDHFIAPKVYGEVLSLSLSVIVISLLIGVELMGMTGAVLALPAAAIIRSLCGFYQKWQETHSEPEDEDGKPDEHKDTVAVAR